ncbi:MAG: hypothetical protein ACTSUW_01810 [Candidatus Heimdallarchaeota archaeon]|nr:hypothetical protein [Candidatus Heimdallarchaeota archaeon]MCK4291337.1 hypothetical protein [Candidatus Heimdallarchaeota archaeon]
MVVIFNLEVLYKSIELILLFWLLGLLFKWVLTFIFGEKGARVIGFLGYTVNFYLKKFVLSKIFKIEVHECDPFRLKFTYEETNRWDILFTSLVLVPMGLGLLLGSLIGAVGLMLESNLVLLSSFLYIFGFLIAVNSVPSFQDIKELSSCSVRSIVIWFVIATVLCAILASVLVPFLNSLGVIIAVLTGIITTTLLTFFIPGLSNKMSSEKSTSLIGGTVDLDG